VSGGGCDSSKPLSQGGCAVDDSDGFFVSPMGSDSGNGAKATPFLTIQKGITAAAAAPLKPNVYVCAGTYPENLVIQNSPSGVGLHGGFDCTSWAQVNAATTAAPPYMTTVTPQYVVYVVGVAALVESMTLVAPDATDPGVSSIAVYVSGSPAITFRRATVKSGVGADGASPMTLAALAPNTAGNPSVAFGGGAAQNCTCPTVDTIGGQGGDVDVDGGGPTNGSPIIAGSADAGQIGTLGPGCSGGNGASGLPAQNGNSTGTLGELTANGWLASPGGAGAAGGTAQGGAGAYWFDGNSTGGGGGACGGCGGSGGIGGGGGGASIALGTVGTMIVRVQGSTFTSGNAGNGGNGAAGQPGQPGGVGGMGFMAYCNGGNGGTGGAGGAAGGGAGGVSIAIATSIIMPDIDSQSAVLAGNAGHGGVDGTAQHAKAIDGIASPTHTF